MPYVYILECFNGNFYTGSTKDLERRLNQHKNSLGANYTKKYGPVKLVYFETFDRIDEAFYREKQIQNWSHGKKKALIESESNELHKLSECKNESHAKNIHLDSNTHPLLRSGFKHPFNAQSSFVHRAESR
jgi:putative endonuclease